MDTLLTGGGAAVGAVALVKLVDLVSHLVKKHRERRDTKPDFKPLSKFDCLKAQAEIRDAVESKLDGFRADLKDSLEKISAVVQRHEDTWHSETYQKRTSHPGL